MATLLDDARASWRHLWRRPGLTALLMLSLGVGIGATTAIFTVVNAVLLQDLPVSHPEQLVLLEWQSLQGTPKGAIQSGFYDEIQGLATSPSFSYATFETVRRANANVTWFAFVPAGRANVAVQGEADAATIEMVTGTYFSVLGVSPIIGRAIDVNDEQGHALDVAVISDGYWSRRFGRAPDAVGQAITINGVPCTIVGVAPRDFFGLRPGFVPDVWVPLVDHPALRPWGLANAPLRGNSLYTANHWWWLMIGGRLSPGITAPQVRDTLEQQVRQTPDFPSLHLRGIGRGLDTLRDDLSRPLLILMAAAALLLLIACANVASLLLAEATATAKDTTIMLALGASLGRVVRQCLAHGLLLALGATAIGLLFAFVSTRAMLALLANAPQPITVGVRLDMHLLAFGTVVSLLTALAAATLPALYATRLDLSSALKGTPGVTASVSCLFRIRPGGPLVVGQIAIALLLVTGAGLLTQTLGNLKEQAAGIQSRHLVLFSVSPQRPNDPPEAIVAAEQELARQIERVQSVASAGISDFRLFGDGANNEPLAIEGLDLPPNRSNVTWSAVGGRFFETLGLDILAGRMLQPGDVDGSRRVAVINELAAQRLFGSANPLGHRFRFWHARNAPDAFEVVGVTRNVKLGSLRRELRPLVFIPYTTAARAMQPVHWAVRVRYDTPSLIADLRRAVAAARPQVALHDVESAEDQLHHILWREELVARLSIILGALALTLASIGLYGLVSRTVARRTREIGVRMILGASRHSVRTMVMRQVLGVVVAGLLVGMLLALITLEVVSSVLFGLTPRDPLTLIVAAVVIIAVAFAAGYLPSRRAAALNPVATVRFE